MPVETDGMGSVLRRALYNEEMNFVMQGCSKTIF
jgi:hypothetical protein